MYGLLFIYFVTILYHMYLVNLLDKRQLLNDISFKVKHCFLLILTYSGL